ncbi:transmembrane protein, putative (macronuclear) [Tetrahymena thermophila SB210]|uniref:Transmembrane protein, putative n=1 Tax=Tetrahymena thermophila (strain SB210) TaxID=312017 RepID=W7X554_TETTS|nr:transmembrane protein, putative [Tetrahymena thermophila SB210]EWS74500.1 transmembrane protein, putative [Tetrahymena thermophila SB210]|eukprot:XP_012652985.1 transmembrane protein, putative [Tetrahymena thermophila SB210]
MQTKSSSSSSFIFLKQFKAFLFNLGLFSMRELQISQTYSIETQLFFLNQNKFQQAIILSGFQLSDVQMHSRHFKQFDFLQQAVERLVQFIGSMPFLVLIDSYKAIIASSQFSSSRQSSESIYHAAILFSSFSALSFINSIASFL